MSRVSVENARPVHIQGYRLNGQREGVATHRIGLLVECAEALGHGGQKVGLRYHYGHGRKALHAGPNLPFHTRLTDGVFQRGLLAVATGQNDMGFCQVVFHGQTGFDAWMISCGQHHQFFGADRCL